MRKEEIESAGLDYDELADMDEEKRWEALDVTGQKDEPSYTPSRGYKE